MSAETPFHESNAFLAACEGDQTAVGEILSQMNDGELLYCVHGAEDLLSAIYRERRARRAAASEARGEG